MAGLAWGLAAASSAAPPKRGCPAGKALSVVNGARSCIPAARIKARPVRTTRTADFVATGLAGPPVRSLLRGGRPVPQIIPARLARLLAARYPGAEAALTTAARTALAARQTSRAHAVTVRQSAPTVTIKPNGTVAGSASISATDGASSVTLDLGITGSSTDGFGFSVDLTADTPAGSASAGGSISDLGTGANPDCPTATGDVRIEHRMRGQKRSSETFRAGPATLGTVRQATTVTLASQASPTMNKDARLTPFPFSVTVTLDHSRTAQALAFIQSRARAVVRGTLTGTMDPATGAISGGSTSITARASGFAADDATSTAQVRAIAERMLKDETGRLLQSARDVEDRARAGKCTRLVFDPESPGALDPDASRAVTPRLQHGATLADIGTVRWQATAQKGTVSPASSSDAKPSLTVKAASEGPETARITVRATSPAGISEGTWTGKEEDFPLTYSGTASQTQSFIAPAAYAEGWQGSLTYTRTSQQRFPDGTRTALYALTSARIDQFAGTGGCTFTAPAGGVVRAGDIEILVDPQGRWTTAVLADVEMPTVSMTCTPAPPSDYLPKAFMNTRTVAGALRPMPRRGTIEGTAVTDTAGSALNPTTATWRLVPAG